MKFGYIDALRGYAIIGVLMVHSLAGESGILGAQLLGLGAKGVQLFYMMSALTLLLSYQNRKSERSPTTNFFLRRAYRIAPLFWVAIIYYTWHNYGIEHPVGDYQHVTIGSYLSHILLLHGFSPYWMNSLVPGGWSVGVEFMFYLTCPLWFVIIKNKAHALSGFVTSYVIGQIAFTYLMKNPLIPYVDTWGGYMYAWLPSQLQVFMMGFYCYYLISENIRYPVKEIVGCFTFLFMFEFLVMPMIFTSDYSAFNGLGINALVTLFFISFIILVRNDPTKLLAHKAIQYVGRISYSLYLVHFAVLSWLTRMAIDKPFNAPEANYI
ncbi:acyltransferase [Coraliomargarita sp. SDUM461004]|uniref:Acyltransferase n=1 Tax=Thalassobacterium sedimentorum TaxID=3041258 RepID=A0ABU1AMA8_9BACT|nr:acyltransferase [Coraliomargarita sp. SDUM461004]MDQ8195942.1 acyltransferase [Coraliomargarita sp. SDUM461004]